METKLGEDCSSLRGTARGTANSSVFFTEDCHLEKAFKYTTCGAEEDFSTIPELLTSISFTGFGFEPSGLKGLAGR